MPSNTKRLDFEPEAWEQLRRRFPAALEKVWETNDLKRLDDAGEEFDRPGVHREYVFDTLNGLRLIISCDRYGDNRMVHVSVSFFTDRLSVPDRLALESANREFAQRTFVSLVKAAYRYISCGVELGDEPTFVTEGGIPHWLVEV